MIERSQNEACFSKKRRLNGRPGLTPFMDSVVGSTAFLGVCLLFGLAITSLQAVPPTDEVGSSGDRSTPPALPVVQANDFEFGDAFSANQLRIVTNSSGDTTTYSMTASDGPFGLLSDSGETITSLGSNSSSGFQVTGIDNTPGSTGISAGPVPAAPWLFGSALLGICAITRKKANGNNEKLKN